MAAAAEPAELVAGDSWSWARPDLAIAWPSAEGWSLPYHLAPETGGGVARTIAAPDCVVAVPPSATDYPPGRWRWTATVASPSARHTVGWGVVTIRPDPASATPVDTRSVAARMLAAIDDTLARRVNADAEAYSIEGRSISRTPFEALMKARGRYAELVRRENGGAAVQTTRVSFL